MARRQGNEGRARVCARRAAGVILQHYYADHLAATRNNNAYDLLNHLASDNLAPMPARQIARQLIQRVDENYQLPQSMDLISDARKLKEILNSPVQPL